MPEITRLHWLENLLQTKDFKYNMMIRFAGIYLVDEIKEKNVFGVFAQYRDHERLKEVYPYVDGIYLSNEMTEGNPLHELACAAHEVGHFKLMADGVEYGSSEPYADVYAQMVLLEFFPKLAGAICRAHSYGDDPCQIAGVRERAEVLAKGNQREREVGKRILKYLGKSAGISERIVSLEKRLRSVRR